MLLAQIAADESLSAPVSLPAIILAFFKSLHPLRSKTFSKLQDYPRLTVFHKNEKNQ